MYCVKCGTEIDEKEKFCTNCGEKKQEEIDNGKLTYSQNPNIKTTYNTPDESNPVEYKEKSITLPTTDKDKNTTISLVLGVLSIGLMCFSPILATIGLIFGIISKERSTKRTIAIVLNSISIVTSIIMIIGLALSN